MKNENENEIQEVESSYVEAELDFMSAHAVSIEEIEALRTENETLKKKLEKLKSLMLLVDPVVSGVVVGNLQLIQWNEYIKVFKDEDDSKPKRPTRTNG